MKNLEKILLCTTVFLFACAPVFAQSNWTREYQRSLEQSRNNTRAEERRQDEYRRRAEEERRRAEEKRRNNNTQANRTVAEFEAFLKTYEGISSIAEFQKLDQQRRTQIVQKFEVYNNPETRKRMEEERRRLAAEQSRKQEEERTRRLVKTFPLNFAYNDHSSRFYYLSGGKRMVLESNTGIRMLDSETGKELWRVPETSVSFTPDSRYTIIANYETSKLLDFETRSEINAFPFRAEFDPSGKFFWGIHESFFRIGDVQTGQELWSDKLSDSVSFFGFSPDGQKLLFQSSSYAANIPGHIYIRDSKTGKVLRGIYLPGNTYFRDLRYSPDGKLILAYSGKTTAKIFDSRTGKTLADIPHPLTNIDSDATLFSKDSSKIISVTEDNKIIIINTANGSEIRNIDLDHAQLRQKGLRMGSDLDFSPDIKKIVYWDNSPGKVQHLEGDYRLYTLNPGSAAWSPDGKYIAVFSEKEKEIKIWNAETGTEARTFVCGREGFLGIKHIAWNPAGNHIAAFIWNFNTYTVEIWDFKSGIP
jgi:WD40 repeat protein